MQRFILSLFLMCAASLAIAGQENELNIPAEVAPFVGKDAKAIALETADLNGDGTRDFVLVLEDLKEATDEAEQGRRSLLILTGGADKKLTLAKRNDKGVVFCRTCGGIFGDPFASIEVAPKTFTVNMYGGSNWRWSYSYKFNYSRIDKTWQIVRVEESSFHTSAPEKIKTVVHTPPKSFGKIDIADFDPENYLKKTATKK